MGNNKNGTGCILDHKDMLLETEESRGTRTRSESSFDKDTLLSIVANYIDNLWEGIEERLQYFDSDGTTSWSEAPAEGVFLYFGLYLRKKTSYQTFKFDQNLQSN